jgi:hypothetical protein
MTRSMRLALMLALACGCGHSANTPERATAQATSVPPTARGLDPAFAVGHRLDVVLVRAPHDELLRWFRAGGATVDDDVLGAQVAVGTGNALLLRLAGQRWTCVFERDAHGSWPQRASAALHAQVLLVHGGNDGGPLGYVLHDDGVEVERLTPSTPPKFSSALRSAPANLDDDEAIVDAMLRAHDAFVPLLDWASCCVPLDRFGAQSRCRIVVPTRTVDGGSGAKPRAFDVVRSSWIAW